MLNRNRRRQFLWSVLAEGVITMRSLEELAAEGELMYSWETELVKQQLYDIIKEAMYAKTVGRQLVDVIPLKAGHEMDFVLADKDSMKMRFVTEGATFMTDVEAYTKRTITPIKYGNLVVISQEIREDANWPVMKRNLKIAGVQAALKEDYLVFTAFNDSTYGISSDSNQYANSSGTELSIYDIATGMKAIEDDDYEPNTIVLHPTQVAELRQIETFVEADKVGSDITMQRGFVGKIFGMDVIRTTKAYIDQTTSQYAWILDTTALGVLVVKRPLTMRAFEMPERDAVATAISFREEAGVLRPKAGYKITIV